MTDESVQSSNEFLGHPKGLYVCFLTEMWERFSFYGMKFLLLLYLTKYHLFTDSSGLDVLGAYAALAYAMPIIGGLLADRYLGMRKAVIFGGVLLCLGHLGMAYEGHAAYKVGEDIVRDNTALKAFYFSIALIIMGVGFLKPNISTIVGKLYPDDDPRRDSGFTIFYMGINLGAAAAGLLCGWLGEAYGWRYGFGAAGIGMIVGLITFCMGQKHLHGHAEPKNPDILKEKIMGMTRETTIYLGGILGVFVIWLMVQHHTATEYSMHGMAIVVSLWMIYFISFKCSRIERHRMIVLVVLIFSSVVFWSLFEQAGGSMTLFADRVVNRSVFGNEIKASQFGSLNAIFIILLAPVFAWIWAKLAKMNMEPSTPMKFVFGIAQAGLGFGALVIGASMPEASGKVALIWLVLAYLLHTTGELSLSPVGLSAVTRLSVPSVVGFMMGAWFMATAYSEMLAAQLSKLASVSVVDGKNMDINQIIQNYTALFQQLMITGLVVAFILLLFTPLLKKGINSVEE